MKTQSLMTCLNILYQQYGPPMEKSAEAQYFYKATERDRTLEALGSKLVKIATVLNADPWDLAVRAARGIENLEKIAAQPGPYQDTARFYMNWANEVEKRAAIPGMNLVRAGIGTAKTLFKRPWTTAGKMQAVSAGKSLPQVGVKQTFQKELQKHRGISELGGGSHRRGERVLAAERPKVVSGEREWTPGPAAPTTVTAPGPAMVPAAAPAAPAAKATTPPAELAPTTVPEKKKFISKGDLAWGGGLMGLGMLGSGYLGSKIPQQPVQPMMDEMYY